MILVTGGTGLLGAHLLLDLVLAGKDVRAIKRTTSNPGMVRKVFSYYVSDPDELAARITWVDADLLDDGAMEDALEGISQVYHTAALVSFDPADSAEMLKVNIDGTANLVNRSIAAGISKFCHVSSIATLGRAGSKEVCTEDTFWVTSKKNSVYSISKYGAEREVWRGMEEGLPAVIINPAVILGPGFWYENSALFRMVHDGLRFYTSGVNGYVDVRDVSKAMIGLMDGNHFGERFICSAANISYRELFALIAGSLGKPAPSVHVPPALTSIVWRLDALKALLFRSKPEITRELAATASQIYTYSSDKLIKTLDFQFRSVEESVREICHYFMQDRVLIQAATRSSSSLSPSPPSRPGSSS